jgi:hypothetical protein
MIMNPFKAGQFFSHWLIRVVLVAYIILLFLKQVYPIDLKSLQFYIAAISCLLAVLLFLGGFLSKQGMTVLSGLGITVIFGYLFVVGFSGVISMTTMLYLVPCILGFYFFTKGNKN